MIDLHLHTTASDGTSEPEALVVEAHRAGLRTIAVTDHDTVAGVAAVGAAAEAAGLTCIAGIEVTAVRRGRDVHILGYFIDVADEELGEFLAEQRADRRRRAIEITRKLAALGVPIDEQALLASEGRAGRSIGRPLIAAELVAAGHVPDMAEAFNRYLADGRPAYVTRRGASPADVIRRIARAGGLASFAHPGKFADDSVLEPMIKAGLTAVEVFHPDHDEATTAHYAAIARKRGLAMTGGSDYHGPDSLRAAAFGRVHLPREAYDDFVRRAGRAPAATSAS